MILLFWTVTPNSSTWRVDAFSVSYIFFIDFRRNPILQYYCLEIQILMLENIEYNAEQYEQL